MGNGVILMFIRVTHAFVYMYHRLRLCGRCRNIKFTITICLHILTMGVVYVKLRHVPVTGQNGSGQNGMDKMVYGQNGIGQNGIGQNGTILYFVYILIQFNSIYRYM